MILYSAKSTIDGEGTLAYRVTKFADGEVESSYLTTFETCNCPAGVRPTCRHREMIGIMIAEDIVNTHWFWNHDRGMVVDFEGLDAGPLLRHPDLPAGEALQGDLPLEPTTPIPPGTYTITQPDETGTSEIVSGEYRGHKVKVPAHTWRRF